MNATAEQLDFEGIKSDANVKKGMWSQISAYRKDSKETGGLVLRAQAGAVLEISPSRMYQLVKDDRFQIYEHFGKEMFGADEIIEYARIAKISGKGGVAQKKAWDATKAEIKTDVRKGKAVLRKLGKKLQKSTTSR